MGGRVLRNESKARGSERNSAAVNMGRRRRNGMPLLYPFAVDLKCERSLTLKELEKRTLPELPSRFRRPLENFRKSCSRGEVSMPEIERRKTPTVKIGHVRVGWEVPVVVQSMTNTDTADVAGTVEQVAALALSGSEIVRVTVNNEDARGGGSYGYCRGFLSKSAWLRGAPSWATSITTGASAVEEVSGGRPGAGQVPH